MEIRERTRDGVLILELKGSLDAIGAKSLDAKLKEVNREGEVLLLNCKHLSYISSPGMRSIMMAAKGMGDLQGHFALCEVPDLVKSTLSISSLTSVFPIYEKERDAVQALRILV